MGGFLGWLTGENQADEARNTALEISNSANARQTELTKEGMAQYMTFLNKAIESGDMGLAKSIAMQLAGGQANMDLARAGAKQQMSWNLPTQAASISALQALPQMQMLMGMPAYNIPTSIDTSIPDAPNLASLYNNAMNTGQGGVGSGGAGGVGTPGTSSAFNLTPYSGKAMDITKSPMFQWQNQQMNENVNRNLAARGFGSSPAAAAILADEYSKLTGAETDKTYNRLAEMVGMGARMPGATGGTAAGTTMAGTNPNLMANMSSLYNDSAMKRAGLYEGAGTTIGSAYGALGTAAGALGSSQANAALSNQSKSPLSLAFDAAKLYSMFGTGGGSGAGTATSALNYPSYSGPNALPNIPW